VSLAPASTHTHTHTHTRTTIVAALQTTTGQSNLKKTTLYASPPHTDGSVVSARLRQCAPLSETCFLGSTRVHIPDGISMGSAVLHSSLQEVPISLLYNGRPLSPSKLPLHMRGSGPPSNTWFLGPTRVHNLSGISIGSAVFCRAHSRDRETDRQTTLLRL